MRYSKSGKREREGESAMLRRTARLRREYLYRKSLEGREREDYERKRAIREALENGKPIPTELKADAARLAAEDEQDDERTGATPGGGAASVDDEYASASVQDPKVLVTTSRDPSSRLAQFAKEVKLMLPSAVRVNRGGQVVSELVGACRKNQYTDIIVLHEHRGEPDGMVVSHLPFGPTAYFGLSNAVLRHDIQGGDDAEAAALGKMKEAAPHLIFDRFGSKLGARVSTILKHLFPVPRDDVKRVMTFANRDDFISFRHHTYEMPKGSGSLELKEVGPRFEMRLFQIKLGTMDQQEAENEWVLRPYMNSAKKRRLL